MRTGPAETSMEFAIQVQDTNGAWVDCAHMPTPKDAVFGCFDRAQIQKDRTFRAVMRLTCVISPQNPTPEDGHAHL